MRPRRICNTGDGETKKKNTMGLRCATNVYNAFRKTVRVIAETIHIKYRCSYPGGTYRYKLSFVAAKIPVMARYSLAAVRHHYPKYD